MRSVCDLTVRDMVPGDVAEVARLEREIFPSPWSETLFRREIARGEEAIYLVAAEGDRLLGYLGADLIGQEVHLVNMAVQPHSQGKGVGTSMLLECIRRAMDRDARWLWLEVREGNSGAREFYKRFGFEEVGTNRGYYTDSGEDAVIMATGNIRSIEFRTLLAEIEASLRRGEEGP